jgi:hypothetical protein
MKKRRSALDDLQELPSALCSLRLLILEYQPLLLWRFDRTGGYSVAPTGSPPPQTAPNTVSPDTP